MIEQATFKDIARIAPLAVKLWPENTLEAMIEEMHQWLEHHTYTIFYATDGDTIIGWAQVGLRHDYVEGTETSPVGYLEGIYVEEHYRFRGVATQLVERCEAWAKDQGCSEFASDILIDNEASYKFHMKYGFTEANRLICFTKSLD